MRDSLGGAAWTVLFGLMALLMSSGVGATINLDSGTDWRPSLTPRKP